MSARYAMTIHQSNWSANRASVMVVAKDAAEAKRKALALVPMHSPIVDITSVREIMAPDEKDRLIEALLREIDELRAALGDRRAAQRARERQVTQPSRTGVVVRDAEYGHS